MKFLCDEMLARLGRWLRAAGYDTLIAESQLSDREILKLAIDEKRFLLTRDRHFLTMVNADSRLVWLQGNSLEECVQELNQKLSINWLYKPFSRCLICNREVILADEKALQSVSDAIKAEAHLFMFCETCHKVYWEGSHTSRMRHQLQCWTRD